jgi:16S rRNA (adenine1518-N6/adenine1519-N6)-dimethyltransferase
MSLQPIAEIVKKYGLQPIKSLGQNFIFDGNVTDKIVSFSGKLENKIVIEIGPGPGCLTRSILKQKPKKLIVIEMDTRAIEALEELKPFGNIEIINGDALKIPLCDIIPSGEKCIVIANLPYNISVPILVKLVKEAELVEQLILMFQKEVANRITSTDGKKSYGRISILAQSIMQIDSLFDLPPTVFVPPPKVTSTILKFIPLKQPLTKDLSKLEKVTNILFSQRRKMLKASLVKLLPEEEYVKIGINHNERPENLSVETICRLSEIISNI